MDKVDALFEKIAIIDYPGGKPKAFGRPSSAFGGAASAAGDTLKKSPGLFGKLMNNVKGVGKHTSKAFGRVGMQAGVFGAGLIISQFAESLINDIKAKRLEAKSPEFYKKMLETHPSLLEYDPKEISMLWETLWNSAPHAAQDPVMAGAFIKQNLDKEVVKEHGGPPLDTYKMLSDIEKSRSSSGGSGKPQYLDIFMDMLKDEN